MTKSVEATAVRPVPQLIRRPTGAAFARRRILVAIGLFRDDAPAVKVAASFASALAAELLLVGIARVALPEPDSEMHLGGHWPRTEVDEQELLDHMMRDRLCEVAARLTGGVRVRTILDWGPRASGLLHACREERPGLVVVPVFGGGPLRRLLSDHATRAVLRRVVPVLVVPMPR